MPDSLPPDASVTAWALIVPEAMEDEASGLIWNAGCTGITIEKAGEAAIRLVCFFEDPNASEFAEEVQRVAADLKTTATRVEVPNPDWVERFKETFVAFDVPPFRVVPEWASEDETAPASPPLTLRVDPGRAFGTGTHESTRLCLLSLGAIAPDLPRSPVTLDLGCGTGILGIAASKLVGASVTASDYDPLATSSARTHAAMNGVSIEVVQMDGCRGLSPGRFELVFANLMAPFLIDRVGEITAVGAPGGRFILAGLLREEEEAVRAAWPSDWKVQATYLGEWASLLYEHP